MKRADKSEAYEFTMLSDITREGLDEFVGVLHSREDIEELIDEFVSTNADGKGHVERELVEILVRCDSITHYTATHSTSTICTAETRLNRRAVLEAAKKYGEYVKCFPGKDSLNGRFLEEKFREQLKKILDNSASSADYITRLVNERMAVLSPELVCEGDSTRLMIFKQFLKASGFPADSCQPRSLKKHIVEITGLSAKPGKDEITSAIRSLTDIPGGAASVFDGLDYARNQEWEALVWADDISRGYFNDQRTTRIKLYWFAVIFEMTFNPAPGFGGNSETDIQKKLFYDYYADNLLNNLLVTNPADLKLVESEPTGHGINIKNFVEVIYLYYIHKKDITPAQRLAKIKKMIRDCKVTGEKEIKAQLSKHAGKDTWLYEPVLKRLMNLEEESLCAYIRENYVCGKSGTNPVRASEENASAAQIYAEMVEELRGSCLSVFDEAQISYEKLYAMMETKYTLGKECAKCSAAAESEFYKSCAFFETECAAAYDDYAADCAKNNRTPKPKAEYYLGKCAGCETAAEENLCGKCPENCEKCKKSYTDYRIEMTPAEEKKEKDEIVSRLTKNAVFDFFRSVCDLTGEAGIFEDDEKITLLLKRIARKFKFIERQTTVNEFIDSKFLPTQADYTADKSGSMGRYVTRTKMIILYYYIFMVHCIADGYTFDSFRDFYDTFCFNFELKFPHTGETFYGLNVLLEMSGYQEINPKNIFDITVIFLAIRKLSMLVAG